MLVTLNIMIRTSKMHSGSVQLNIGYHPRGSGRLIDIGHRKSILVDLYYETDRG